jgi:hypothetical protein
MSPNDTPFPMIDHLHGLGTPRVTCLNVPLGASLLALSMQLVNLGVAVTVVSNDAPADSASASGEIVSQLRSLLGANARIASVTEYPSTAAMIGKGEFATAGCLVSTLAFPGLLAALQAAGMSYGEADGGDTALLTDAAECSRAFVEGHSGLDPSKLSHLGRALANYVVKLHQVHGKDWSQFLVFLAGAFRLFVLALGGNTLVRGQIERGEL